MDEIAREMDPAGAAAYDLHMGRIRAIRKQLKSVSLGSFMASELGALMRVQGLARVSAISYKEPTEADLAILEERLRLIKEKL